MRYCAALFLVLSATLGCAQTVIATFSLPDMTHGGNVSLDAFSGRPAVVVIFTSNACPFDQSYADRISSLIAKYADRVPILLINSHLDAPESEDEMKKKAAGWSLQVPYLSDKSQAAMEALGARRSPEAFVLKPVNGGFTIVYSGAIDDNPQTPGAVTTQYLRDALENTLAGKPAPAPVRAAGCTIRRK